MRRTDFPGLSAALPSPKPHSAPITMAAVAHAGRAAKQPEPVKTVLPPQSKQPKETKPPSQPQKQPPQPAAAAAGSQKSTPGKAAKAPAAVLATFVPKPGASAEKNFCDWCLHELSAHTMDIDAPTFVQFLMDMDSHDSVAEFVYLYLGHSVRATQFKQDFVRRRAELKGGRFATPVSAAPATAAAAAVVVAAEESTAGVAGGKKKKNKGVAANHLLGLSVAPASKPNRGEIETVAK
jgi:hypothetical protein